MCHFVLAILPPEADYLRAEELFKSHGFGFWEWETHYPTGRLMPGERAIATTKGWCDCGTAVGSQFRQERRHTEQDFSARAAQLRRRGWSKPRIDRWQAEKTAHAQRLAKSSRSNDVSELARWLEAIEDGLSSKVFSALGVYLFWPDKHLELSQQLAEREELRAKDVTAERLAMLRENVVYWISRAGRTNQVAAQ